MAQESHWTEESTDAFAHRLAFDFIANVENRLAKLPMKQSELAQKLGVSEGAVSKLLNNPQNLTIRTIANYSRALGMKASIVSYDDGDAQNLDGPINSSVFTACWERAGRPKDLWALEASPVQNATTYNVAFVNLFFANIDAFGGMQLKQASVVPTWFLSRSASNVSSTAVPVTQIPSGGGF
ncbi:hypothetical protein SBA6_510012 [Candidatus Sulfopaludibacter sp. SbA6]|nr:hypothetical protein SBA6_510012 [Candidatus Sulfopaludibacter sp. SbA6]